MHEGEFEAALNFLNSLHYDGGIDEFLGELGDEGSDYMAITSGSPSNTRKRKKLKHNKAREERKAELQRLRHEVGDLEFTLKRLQTIRGRNQDSTTKNSYGEGSVWRDTCLRQLERRLRAEREQIHLTKNIEKEKQLINSMKDLLDKRPALWNMVYPGARKRSRRINVPAGEMKHMADLIFQQLSVGVDVAYQNVENVDKAVSPMLEKLPPGKPLLRDISGKRAEAFGINIVPFSMVETSNAWWQYWNNYRGEIHADDVVTESFGLEISDVKANVSARFYVQQILWRHIEDHRIVFVWSGYVEPFLFKGKRVRGVYYNEHSYVLIKPGKCEDEAITTLSSCETITPQFLDPKLNKDPTVVALTKFLVSAMPSDILTWNEVVENLLLDQMLQNRRSG